MSKRGEDHHKRRLVAVTAVCGGCRVFFVFFSLGGFNGGWRKDLVYGGWLVGVKKALLGTRKSSNTLHVTRKPIF